MSYLITFMPLASEDLTEILGWYKNQQNDSDKRFIIEMSKVLKRLESLPQTFPFEHPPLRKGFLKKFPYKVLYFIDEIKLEILIVAVVHQSRHPDFWKSRI